MFKLKSIILCHTTSDNFYRSSMLSIDSFPPIIPVGFLPGSFCSAFTDVKYFSSIVSSVRINIKVHFSLLNKKPLDALYT